MRMRSGEQLVFGVVVIAESSNWDLDPALEHISAAPVLGSSPVARIVERLNRSGADDIAVLAGTQHHKSSLRVNPGLQEKSDTWRNVAMLLDSYDEKGCDAVLIAFTSAYVEFDAAVLLGWHRGHGEPITRVYDRVGALDTWMVDPRRFREREALLQALREAKAAQFEVQGYVNRLEGPMQYRQLVVDILSSRCETRPKGTEIRTGVWVGEGAQIARGARVVAPAFLGRNVKVAEECLITRCSNVEQNSYVDFGTAVEDSSILPNTYIGIGLDLAHSIVDGGEMVNLRHGVKLQITDPVVMRRNTLRGQARNAAPEFDLGEIASFPGAARAVS